jgi:hypothetical protein
VRLNVLPESTAKPAHSVSDASSASLSAKIFIEGGIGRNYRHPGYANNSCSEGFRSVVFNIFIDNPRMKCISAGTQKMLKPPRTPASSVRSGFPLTVVSEPHTESASDRRTHYEEVVARRLQVGQRNQYRFPPYVQRVTSSTTVSSNNIPLVGESRSLYET